MLVKRWWNVTADGKRMTDAEHSEECRRVKHSIRVVGFEWEAGEETPLTLSKTYTPHVPIVSLLKDRSGFIVTEPKELAGDDCVVVINADGTERYRLKGALPTGMFPAYMDGGKLVMHENSREHDGYAAMFEDAGGTRIVEFDQETGQYTGKFLSIRY
jgi:hypothetical protein